MLAYVEWGLARGVNAIVCELAPIQMLKFVQCHFLAHPSGITQSIGGSDTIAILALFDQRTQARLHELVELGEPMRRKA